MFFILVSGGNMKKNIKYFLYLFVFIQIVQCTLNLPKQYCSLHNIEDYCFYKSINPNDGGYGKK